MTISAPSDFNQINPATTKGDLIVRASTYATRLPVGANDTVLVADSTADSGLKWEAPLDAAGVTASAAELNKTDQSAETETVSAAGAISVTKRITKLDSTGGTFAATLAAPDATMLGVVKIIEMTVDNGNVTLALTNVQGQSSGTTATFGDVNDTLVLIGGTTKWHVIGESGIALA